MLCTADHSSGIKKNHSILNPVGIPPVLRQGVLHAVHQVPRTSTLVTEPSLVWVQTPATGSQDHQGVKAWDFPPDFVGWVRSISRAESSPGKKLPIQNYAPHSCTLSLRHCQSCAASSTCRPVLPAHFLCQWAWLQPTGSNHQNRWRHFPGPGLTCTSCSFRSGVYTANTTVHCTAMDFFSMKPSQIRVLRGGRSWM